jgi:hypothetical protein
VGLHAGRQAEHVAARHQDLAQDAVGDLEGPADDGPLLGREVLLGRDHVADLLGADLLALCLRVAAGEADHQVGRDTEQPYRRAGDHREDVQRTGDQHGPALRTLHCNPLRCEFADDQRDERQDDGDQHDRGRLGRRAQETERFDQRLGQRDGRGRRREKPGERDADLDGRQEPVRVTGEPAQHPTAPRLPLQPLHLALPQLHERHLAARERRVHQHEHQDEDDLAA